MEIPIPTDFTLEELRAFLEGQEGKEPLDGYHTTKEWCEWSGLSAKSMYELLHKAKKEEVLQITWVIRESLSGTRSRVPAYKFDIPSSEGGSDGSV